MAHSMEFFEETVPFNKDSFTFLKKTAKKSGLTSEYLSVICSWIESEEINECYKLKLIECLIPTQHDKTIPDEVCIRLASLLKGSPSTTKIKVEILKWLICIHSFMEINGRFKMLYEFFLLLLKDEELRDYVAHLLYLMTQKKHVTFKRVKCLFRYMNEYGRLPCFILLLRAFFIHAPEYFEDELNEDIVLEVEDLGSYPTLIKNVHCAYSLNFSTIFATTIENSTTTVLTDFNTLTEKLPESPSFVLSEFYQLYKEFRTLERSTDMSKILESGLRRLFLTSRLDEKIKIKIVDYIISMLHNEFESEGIVERHSEIFRLQHSLPHMWEFTEFLSLKDDWEPDFAESICFQPICCFKKIHYKLQLMRGKFLTTEDVRIKCQWLNSLSKMFCYWVLQGKYSVPCEGMCDESDFDSTSDTLVPKSHIPATEISQLGSEIDFLCDSLLMEDCSPFVLGQILLHYQMCAIVRQQKKSTIPCFPSPAVFQLSLFSLNPYLLEILSDFMLRVNAIYHTKSDISRNEEFLMFQAALYDIKKLFLTGSYKSENTYLATTKTFKKFKEMSDLKGAFILYKHPALLCIAREFGDEKYLHSFLHEKTGNRKQESENRKQFYGHLAKNGSKDFVRLISTFK